MALLKQFKPIKDAVLDHLSKKNPNDVIFVIGGKSYTAKDVEKHFKKEDKFSEILISYAIKSNSTSKTFDINLVSDDEINATVKMFLQIR